jgi:hypothetical protein
VIWRFCSDASCSYGSFHREFEISTLSSVSDPDILYLKWNRFQNSKKWTTRKKKKFHILKRVFFSYVLCGGLEASLRALNSLKIYISIHLWNYRSSETWIWIYQKACIQIQGIWIPEHYFIFLSVSRIFFFIMLLFVSLCIISIRIIGVKFWRIFLYLISFFAGVLCCHVLGHIRPLQQVKKEGFCCIVPPWSTFIISCYSLAQDN